MDKTQLLFEKLKGYFLQEIEVACETCKNKETVIIMHAWLSNITCSKCGNEIMNHDEKAKKFSDKMPQHLALITNAMMAVFYQTQKLDSRQIVIDANCAMEILLREKVENHLRMKRVDEDLVGFLIGNIRTMENTVKLLRALKFRHPKEIEDKMKRTRGLRNKVAHQAYVPTRTETKATVFEILGIMNEIQPPQPTLRDMARNMNRYSTALSKPLKKADQQEKA